MSNFLTSIQANCKGWQRQWIMHDETGWFLIQCRGVSFPHEIGTVQVHIYHHTAYKSIAEQLWLIFSSHGGGCPHEIDNLKYTALIDLPWIKQSISSHGGSCPHETESRGEKTQICGEAIGQGQRGQINERMKFISIVNLVWTWIGSTILNLFNNLKNH